jgi:hypothetical protein
MGSALTSLLTTQFRIAPTTAAWPCSAATSRPPKATTSGRVHQTLGELWASGVAIDLVGNVLVGNVLVGKVTATRPAPVLPG